MHPDGLGESSVNGQFVSNFTAPLPKIITGTEEEGGRVKEIIIRHQERRSLDTLVVKVRRIKKATIDEIRYLESMGESKIR